MKNFGQNLVKSGHSDAAEIKKASNKLEDAKEVLIQAWEGRKTTLDQALDFQVSYEAFKICGQKRIKKYNLVEVLLTWDFTEYRYSLATWNKVRTY